MKTLVALTLLLSLQGCFYQSVRGSDVRFMQDFCEDKGGVYWIDSLWHGETQFVCTTEYENKGAGLLPLIYVLKDEVSKITMEEFM